MRRPSAAAPTDMQGQDSFLDIVANMVGILIILVMVVGVRASYAPSGAPAADVDAGRKREVAALLSQSASLERDVLELHQQAERVRAAMASGDLQREELATAVAAIEAELAERRAALSTESRADYDLRVRLAQARDRLQQLQLEQAALENHRPETVKVQSLPTPISKTVHGKEVHFQLRDNYLAHIPLEELLEDFRNTAKHKLWKLDGQSQVTDVVGPLGGFRLRYQLGRFEIPLEMQRETGRSGSVVRLIQWELLPVSAQVGEPIEAALRPGSEFRSVIRNVHPASTVVTIWTYPESFDSYRKLKAELHALGIPTASRPLPRSQTIGGSPEGSRSAAQ